MSTPEHEEKQNPGRARKGHTKSRKGCKACKRRHIKCDEAAPRCSYCTRLNVVCERPTDLTPSQSTVSSPASNTHVHEPVLNRSAGTTSRVGDDAQNVSRRLAVDQLSLLHYFITVTYSTLEPITTNGHIWKEVMINIGFQHQFVLHGILAVTALHKVHNNPAERSKLLVQAHCHHDFALSEFRAVLSHMDAINCTAAFAFSCITVVYSFAVVEVQEPGELLEAHLNSLHLVRGTVTVLQPYWDVIMMSEVAPLVQNAERITLAGQVPEILALKEMISSCTDLEKVEAYTTATDECHKIFLEVVSDNKSRYDLASLFSWAVILPDVFIQLLSARDQIALVILAHFAVLFHLKRDYWWLRSWYRRLLAAIELELSPPYQSWLSWPKRFGNVSDAETRFAVIDNLKASKTILLTEKRYFDVHVRDLCRLAKRILVRGDDMVKRKLGALEKVDADLPNLQHKIKRDPPSYIADFQGQYQQYENRREIFMAAPTSTADSGIISLRDLIEFIAHVSDCYPEMTKGFPDELIEILTRYHVNLDAELREKIVGSLVLLRKKEVIDSTRLLQTFFPILTSTPSKTLRTLLYQKILSDLRTSNSKTTNHKLNRTVQTVLHNLVTSDRSSPKALWAVKITRELWRRQIWTDAKAVETMKEAAVADNEKVIIGGVRFFLGGDKEREELEDESSDDEGVDMGKLRHQIGINRKNKKAKKALDKAASTIKKKEKKRSQPHPLNFSALHLLHDPQAFAETLFSKHLHNTKSRLNLEQKLQVLQLVSRLIGLHKLTMISFYSYFLKYLTPKQPSVTSFLASLAQSTHNLVPPDILEPLVQKIANEFVSEASAGEVAASGLNAIREICVRQPLAMNDALLQDLVMYKKSKDKGVMMAAKGLLALYRQVGADMLKKKDRGKDAAIGLQSGEQRQQRFGEEVVGEIEGLELLEQWKAEEKQRRQEAKGLASDASDDEEEDDEDDWNAWDVQNDESDDSSGWISVESDAEINISDSDDDQPRVTKKVKFDGSTTQPSDDKENPPKDLPPKPPSTLATTRILTPADLAKLAELRTTASVSNLLTKSHKSHHSTNTPPTRTTSSHRHPDDPLTATQIEGLASLSAGKSTRAQKLALLQSHREDRELHKSRAARKKEQKESEGKSTTNKEKARKKNFLMTLGKAKMKGKRSLVQHQKILKAHSDRARRGGKRGNAGK